MCMSVVIFVGFFKGIVILHVFPFPLFASYLCCRSSKNKNLGVFVCVCVFKEEGSQQDVKS